MLIVASCWGAPWAHEQSKLYYPLRDNSTMSKFSLGNIPTMSCITDSVGEGWDDGKIAKFFNERNNIVNGQGEVPMTRSKHF